MKIKVAAKGSHSSYIQIRKVPLIKSKNTTTRDEKKKKKLILTKKINK